MDSISSFNKKAPSGAFFISHLFPLACNEIADKAKKHRTTLSRPPPRKSNNASREPESQFRPTSPPQSRQAGRHLWAHIRESRNVIAPGPDRPNKRIQQQASRPHAREQIQPKAQALHPAPANSQRERKQAASAMCGTHPTLPVTQGRSSPPHPACTPRMSPYLRERPTLKPKTKKPLFRVAFSRDWWSGKEDSNLRPLRPERSALPG